MSYAKFRNNDINTLKDKFNKLNGKREFDNDMDETYWTTKHVAGPDGNGEAIIRFLPAPPDGNGGIEPDDIVKYFNFSISKSGKYYINRGRNSLGHDEPDPANDYNNSIWARKDLTKEEKKKKLVNRADNYIANIYVVKDPHKPENEGRVFRFKFGRMIYNMINAQIFPKFETDPSVPVFDPELGADFHFRVTQRTVPDSVTGENKQIPTYESSKFASPSKRWSADEFDKIWSQEHSLQSEIAPEKFKPYEVLKEQFDRVMEAPKNFLDSDEPIKAVNKTNTSKPKEEPTKTMEEIIDDKILWDEDDESTDSNDSSNTSNSDADADDWFAKLA